MKRNRNDGAGQNNKDQYNLPRSYAFASFPVITALVIFIGWWVNQAIQQQVIENSAANVALYVQAQLAPELQSLATSDFLTEAEMDKIEQLTGKGPLGEEIHSVKIWKKGGLVSYYSKRAMIGQRFDPSPTLRGAWSGRVTAEFDDLTDEENRHESSLRVALLEVYSPIRRQGSDEIIAVVEFYQDADKLAAQLDSTRHRTWLIVITATLIAYGLLFFFVYHGGRIIKKQRESLNSKVDELSRLLAENKQLEGKLKRAAQKTAEINEKLLRNVSAELHDGPAQSMGLALLRLDSLLEQDDPGEPRKEIVSELRHILEDSMTELRHISRGLALPDLRDLSLVETTNRVVYEHQRRTKSTVDLYLDEESLDIRASLSINLTLYRVIQELLMNAYRHAGGKEQAVMVELQDDELVIKVSDAGPGFSPQESNRSDRLGLPGLRERIESLGGDFVLSSIAGSGTTIQCTIPLPKKS